ncbi:MAG: ShlB/FhaC/HecB family hemolysin secretion/activation protein [Burkholderiales bacterium]|nr:ShlB/FhaC/HecB family hemolysin secretion/activation protein [Burkholderiales bacterium]
MLALMPALCVALAATVPAAPARAQAADILLEVKRFEIVGENPIAGAATDAALAPHLGVHKSLGTLEAAAAALEARLRDAGYSFHRVIVPAQKPAGGVVRLEILRFPLAQVTVTGNSHFSAANIARSLPSLAAGGTPDVRAISRDLGLANDHPSKRVSIVLKESAKADALDAEIRVRDSVPLQPFISISSHTGDRYDVINKGTGYTRLTFGVQHANLFDLDHVLTGSYTTSLEQPEKVKQYGLFYWLPFYGGGTSLQAYYTRSDVDTGAIGLGTTSFNVSGRGEFVGARLTHALPKWGEITHNLAMAVDDKYFESNVGLAGVALPLTPARSRPLSLRYTARYDQLWGGIGAYGEFATNLAGGSANTEVAYAAVRGGAPVRWSAFRYGIDASYALGTWNLGARLRGQHTDHLMIPGEQFGIGGTTTVRGLREREFTGDNGHTLTLEASGPPLSGTLRPVVFFDHGYARLLGNTVVAGNNVSYDTASSVGVGARWNHGRTIDLTADFAYVANGIGSTGTVVGTRRGDTKLMFTVFFRF